MSEARRVSSLLAVLSLALVGGQCAKPAALIVQPARHQLSLPGDLDVLFYLRPPLLPGSALVELVGGGGASDVTAELHHQGRFFWGTLQVAVPGEYALRVSASGPARRSRRTSSASTSTCPA